MLICICDQCEEICQEQLWEAGLTYMLIQDLRLLFKRQAAGEGRVQEDSKFIRLGAGQGKGYSSEKD